MIKNCTFHATILSLAEDAFTNNRLPIKEKGLEKFSAVLDFCFESNIIESWAYRAALEGFVLRAIKNGIMDYNDYGQLIDEALKSRLFQELPEKWADLKQF